MAPTQARPTVPRKRQRKRKKRAIQFSSSSSSSSDSDPANSDAQQNKTKQSVKVPVEKNSEDSSAISSSSSESSDSDSDVKLRSLPDPAEVGGTKKGVPAPHRRSRSPSPVPVTIPPFMPPPDATGHNPSEEKILKDRFRTFWMSSIADGFKDDLEEIRKEPHVGPSRLTLLIDSLASGAEVFASSSTSGAGVNEMQLALEPEADV